MRATSILRFRRTVRAALAAVALAMPAVGPSGRVPAGAQAGPDASAETAYRIVAADGGVFSFGGAVFAGSTGAIRLAQPIVGTAATASGRGYWLVAADGGVFAFGDAAFAGSTGAIRLAQPIVGMAATPTGRGYWLVARDGGVFAFGDANFAGSTGGLKLAQPLVGMTVTPTGRGYWLVARDGGVFAFGDAAFAGSTGAIRLAQPIVGMAATASGRGYRLVAADGGVFAFGDAAFAGSTGGLKLAQPIVAMAAGPSDRGYWLVARDGGVFAFGDAAFAGSTGAIRLAQPIVAVHRTRPTVAVNTTPTPTAPSGGVAGPSNTGMPDGTALTVVNGDMVINTPGTVVDGRDIRGSVTIRASNVIIRRSVIRGRAGSGGAALLTVASGTGIVIEDSELAAASPNALTDGISGGNFTARRLDIRGAVDGIKAGSGARVEASWIHDLTSFASDPNQGGGETHNDAVQILGGTGIVLAGNTLVVSRSQNAALQVTQDAGTTRDVTVQGNFVDGGGCTLNFAHKGGPTLSGITVTDNRFGRNSFFGCPILVSTQTILTQSGNVYADDNSPVPTQRHD